MQTKLGELQLSRKQRPSAESTVKINTLTTEEISRMRSRKKSKKAS